MRACLENLLSVDAVDVAVMDVNLAMRSRTVRFWTTSSRVGQMQSACAATCSMVVGATVHGPVRV